MWAGSDDTPSKYQIPPVLQEGLSLALCAVLCTVSPMRCPAAASSVSSLVVILDLLITVET